MSLLCAWCGRWIRKSMPVGMISHGICRACADKLKFTEDGEAVRPCPTH